MSFSLSFSDDFFFPEYDFYVEEPNDKPTNLYQAILTLERDNRKDFLEACRIHGIAPDCEGTAFELVEAAKRVDTCTGLSAPIDVWLSEDGYISVEVYDRED